MRIVWYLEHYHGIKISDATVSRILRRHGLVRLPRGTRMRKVHTKCYQKQVPDHHIQMNVKFLTFIGEKGEKLRRFQYTAIDPSQACLAYLEPMTITHELGETMLENRPQNVAVLGMKDLDFLDYLGVPVAGSPKDFVPHFLAKYADDPAVKDLGSIVKPNVEAVYALGPDLVLMTALQAEHYKDIASFSPVLYFNVDYRDSSQGYLASIAEHFLTLGDITEARTGFENLKEQVRALHTEIKDRPEKALILLHNKGRLSSFGLCSRYGFVFNELGVKPAAGTTEAGLHGQPVTSEFILAADPDILLIIDRTSVMQHQPVLTKEQVENPLLKNTKAWENDRVVFVDPDAWYVTSAGPTSVSIMIDNLSSAYQ